MSTKKLVVTGTQAYGPLTSDSDFDIVLRRRHAKVLREILDVLKIKVWKSNHVHPSYEGYYFRFNHHNKVQIIVAATGDEFKAWSEATDMMKDEPTYSERSTRINIFQNIFYGILSRIRSDKSKYNLKVTIIK